MDSRKSYYAQVWGTAALGPFETREDAHTALLDHVYDASDVQWLASDDEPGVQLANDDEGQLLGQVWERDEGADL